MQTDKKMVRFAVSVEVYDRWEREGKALCITVPEYARLKCLGVLKEEAPKAEGTAQVPPLGPRIMAEVERLGWEKISTPAGVNRLAAILKTNHRAVHGALGSLVASRKLRRTVYGYFPVADAPSKEVIDIG